MYKRLLEPPHQSFFLFGPRGTGKSTWTQQKFKDALTFDLLDGEIYRDFLANPKRLEERIPKDYKGWIVLDEIQRVPELLNSVHRLIENRKLKFVLTGSSARKLRTRGVNLLGGRALLLSMFPLTAKELGSDFNLKTSLKFGHLPAALKSPNPQKFLKSYIAAYLREEVQHEGLVRRIDSFARFLESASFSQAQVLNIAGVAQDAGVSRKSVEDYFQILTDLLLAYQLPIFARRAKRKLQTHPKFFFFDCGVFRMIRPQGYLDSEEELDGAALETLLVQEVRALNEYANLEYQLNYWRTSGAKPLEVDLVLYGRRGLLAFEVKRSSRIRSEDFRSLKAFHEDYKEARSYMLYLGTRRYFEGNTEVIPFHEAILSLDKIL